MYDWVPSLFTWNYHNIVNQVHLNKKKKKVKKERFIEISEWDKRVIID